MQLKKLIWIFALILLIMPMFASADFYSDNFDRVDNTTIGGNWWESSGTSWGIVSNVLKPSETNGDTIQYNISSIYTGKILENIKIQFWANTGNKRISSQASNINATTSNKGYIAVQGCPASLAPCANACNFQIYNESNAITYTDTSSGNCGAIYQFQRFKKKGERKWL